jgi:hypothetical protein
LLDEGVCASLIDAKVDQGLIEDSIMIIIIQATPWGVCRRYYDECGDLLFSEYERVPPVARANGPTNVPYDGRGRPTPRTIPGLPASGKKRISRIVEFGAACSTCA